MTIITAVRIKEILYYYMKLCLVGFVKERISTCYTGCIWNVFFLSPKFILLTKVNFFQFFFMYRNVWFINIIFILVNKSRKRFKSYSRLVISGFLFPAGAILWPNLTRKTAVTKINGSGSLWIAKISIKLIYLRLLLPNVP